MYRYMTTYTTAPCIITVIISTVPFTISLMFSTFRSSRIRIALEYLWGIQLLVTFQLSWTLGGLWVFVFLAGTGIDNALSCIFLKVSFLSLQANSVQYKLIIRDVHSLQIIHLYTCLDAIQTIEVRNMYKLNFEQNNHISGVFLHVLRYLLFFTQCFCYIHMIIVVVCGFELYTLWNVQTRFGTGECMAPFLKGMVPSYAWIRKVWDE